MGSDCVCSGAIGPTHLMNIASLRSCCFSSREIVARTSRIGGGSIRPIGLLTDLLCPGVGIRHRGQHGTIDSANESLAEMIGTTRSLVSFFMTRFGNWDSFSTTAGCKSIDVCTT